MGRFTGVDPIAEKFAFVSAFNYAEDEPIANIDLHGLQKFKKIDKPSDFITKAPRNFIEGMKVLGSHISETVTKPAAEFLFDALSSAIPQGRPAAEDFHDSGEEVDGGKEVMTGDNSVPAAGTNSLPNAKNGSDAIVDELLTPGAGIGGKFTRQNSRTGGAVRDFGTAADNAIEAVKNAKSTSDNQKNEVQKLEIDTSFTLDGGNIRIQKFKPKNEDNK